MAEGDNEVKVRVSVDGAPAAQNALVSIINTLQQFSGVIIGANQGLELLHKGLEMLEAPFKAIEANAEAAAESFKHFRSMAATMGGTIEDAELMSNAFALAGLSTEKLTFGMFRLSMAIQQGGKELDHIGVEFKDAEGHIKATGDVFEEVRNRLSQMTNSTERAAEAAKLFGARQARELLPVLSMSAEEYDRLKEKASENSAMNAQLEEAAKGLIESHAELEQKLKKVSTELAVMIAIPIVEFFEHWIAIPIVKYLDDVISRVRGLIAVMKEGQGFWDKFFIGMGTSAAAARETAANLAALEKATAQVNQMKERREAKPSYTEEDRKVELAKLNFAYSMGQQALKFDEQIAAERIKLQTGSDVAALTEKKRSLDEQLKAVEEHAAKEREIMLKGRVKLSGEEEEKLAEKTQKEKEKIREEGAKLELEIEKAKIKDLEKIADQEVAHRKALGQQTLAMLSLSNEAAMVQIKLFSRNQQEAAEAEFNVSMQYNERTRQEKTKMIDDEMAAKHRLLDAARGNADEERKLQKDLDNLQTERVKANVDADKEILKSRQALFDKVKALMEQEAALGESAEQKAIRRLETKGKTKISAMDVAQEENKMEREAGDTLRAFGAGGRVDIAKLQESRDVGKLLAKGVDLGVTPGGAMGVFQQQQVAAYSGQKFDPLMGATEGLVKEFSNTTKAVDAFAAALGGATSALGGTPVAGGRSAPAAGPGLGGAGGIGGGGLYDQAVASGKIPRGRAGDESFSQGGVFLGPLGAMLAAADAIKAAGSAREMSGLADIRASGGPNMAQQTEGLMNSGMYGAGRGGDIDKLQVTMQRNMDQSLDRLDGILGDMFNKFTDGLIRKLEFQAAQQ